MTSHKRHRRIAIEPLETRRLLAATGSISGYVYLDPANAGQMSSGDQGFAGMTVELESVGGSGATTLVSPGGIATTGSDGSYSFSGVAAGTYQLQITPSRLTVGTLSPGSAGKRRGRHERNPVDARRRAGGHRLQLRPARHSAELRSGANGPGNDRNAGQLPVKLGADFAHRPEQRLHSGIAGTTYAVTYTLGGSPVNVAPGTTVL